MEQLCQILKTGTPQQIANELADYYTQYANKPETIANIELKLKVIDVLFDILRDQNLINVYPLALQVMRIFTRDSSVSKVAFDDGRIETLLHLAMLVGEEEALMTETSQTFDQRIVVEAQKCMSNLLSTSDMVRSICSRNSCIEGIMLRLRMHPDPKLPSDVKYFDMLMLFLLTAMNHELRDKVQSDYHGLIYLMEAIDLILKNNAEYWAENVNNRSKRRSKGSRRGRKTQTEHEAPPPPPQPSTMMDTNANNSEDRGDDALVTYCLDDWEVNIAIQVLKVLFNLTISVENRQLDEIEEAHFFRLVSILHDLLLCDTKNGNKREELQSQTVNLLTNMPSKSYEELLSKISELGRPENPEYEYDEMNMEVLAALLKFLDKRLDDINANSSNNLEKVAPILICLAKASSSQPIIRKYIRYQILPPLKDIRSRPEDGTTLRNKLVRFMTSPDMHLKQLTAHLLFVLCKENTSRLIKYTGYGNAAGLLAGRGLLSCINSNSNYSSDSEESDTEEYVQNIDRINPVTGCIDQPRSGPNPLDHMSEEQKEYEANKLACIMDQLHRGGVIQPCKIDKDGRPVPVEHILELQKPCHSKQNESDSE